MNSSLTRKKGVKSRRTPFSDTFFALLEVRNGGGYANLVEPRTVVREYPARWEKPRIDLDELARLRQAGSRTRQIAVHFGVGVSAVKMAYARLRTPPPNAKR